MDNYLEPDYAEQYNAWKSKQDFKTRNAILDRLNPIISQSVIAAGADPTNPVVMTKAKLLALQGLSGYDPQKASLKNYMYSHLRGLNRVYGADANIIQTPESVVLDRKRLAAVEKEIFDETGKYPSSQEIANRAGITLKRLAKIRRAGVPVTEQQVDTVLGGNAPAVQLLGNDTRKQGWMEYVYDSVDDRQKAIMERLYGLHGFDPIPAKDVAKQLKITPAAVSQQRKKIDKLLNSESQFTVFGKYNE